jgi:hypothetical protein
MLDLTIAVIRGMDWAALRPYAISLAKTGFRGEKLVFVENTSQQVLDNLDMLGFKSVVRITPPSQLHPELPPDWAYGIYRFLPAIEYLKARPDKFRYVIWTDVRDVIFQTDPSMWLENNLAPHKIVVAGLGHDIKDCPYNDPWMGSTVPQVHYERIRKTEAVACGTFAGTAEAMLGLFEDIYNGCHAAHTPQGTDQGMLNAIVRHPKYEGIVRIPHIPETFSAQWFPEKINDPGLYADYGFPVFDKATGIVRTPAGEPFSIVHLYDRDPAWVQIMREKYATYTRPDHLWMDAR